MDDIENNMRKGRSTEENIKAYDLWSETYEKMVNEMGYKGPVYTAQTVADLFPTQEERVHTHILDLLSGTGLVGDELAKLGFRKLDALDGSIGMLDVGRKKGVYIKTFCAIIKKGEHLMDIESDTYDVVAMCGGLGFHAFPCEGLDEMLRIVKGGGYIVIVTRPQHLQEVPEYIGKFEAYLKKLEVEGKWTIVKNDIRPNYHSDGQDALIFVYRKC